MVKKISRANHQPTTKSCGHVTCNCVPNTTFYVQQKPCCEGVFLEDLTCADGSAPLTIETGTGVDQIDTITSSVPLRLCDEFNILSDGTVFVDTQSGSVQLQLDLANLSQDVGEVVDFPQDPSVNQIYTDLETGILFVWDGTIWTQIQGNDNFALQNVIIGPSGIPGVAGAQEGSIVYDYVTGAIYIFRNGVWVQAACCAAPAFVGPATGVSGIPDDISDSIFPPQEGSQYVNHVTNQEFVFTNGNWVEIACCAPPMFVGPAVNEGEVEVETADAAHPPQVGSQYVNRVTNQEFVFTTSGWQEDLCCAQPNFVGPATGASAIPADLGEPHGPQVGSQYVNHETNQEFVFTTTGWEEVPCCATPMFVGPALNETEVEAETAGAMPSPEQGSQYVNHVTNQEFVFTTTGWVEVPCCATPMFVGPALNETEVEAETVNASHPPQVGSQYVNHVTNQEFVFTTTGWEEVPCCATPMFVGPAVNEGEVGTETADAVHPPQVGSQYINHVTNQEFVFTATGWDEVPCCATPMFVGPALNETEVEAETAGVTFPPVEGSQYVNHVTNQEFVFTSTGWDEVPCCATPMFVGPAVNEGEVGTETADAVHPPQVGSQYINHVTNQEFVFTATGWDEVPCCATPMFVGPALNETEVEAETSGVTFPPVEGSQYVNHVTNQEFVFTATGWDEVPCCATPVFVGPAVNEGEVGTETAGAVHPPQVGSQYVNHVTNQEFVFTATGWDEVPCCATPMFVGPALNETEVGAETSGATFPPVEGSQYVNHVTNQEFVFTATGWDEVPCCATPMFVGGQTGTSGVDDETAAAAHPPQVGSQYVNHVTNQEFVFTSTGWEEVACCGLPHFTGDAVSVSGVSSETGSEPEIGSQYINQDTSQEFVFTSSGWVLVPCCGVPFYVGGETSADDIMEDDQVQGSQYVNPETQQEFVYTGSVWEEIPCMSVPSFVGLQESVSGVSGETAADVREPRHGSQYVNTATGQEFVFDGTNWLEQPCCSAPFFQGGATTVADVIAQAAGTENTASQYTNPSTGQKFVYDGNMWVEMPCCGAITTTSSMMPAPTGATEPDTIPSPLTCGAIVIEDWCNECITWQYNCDTWQIVDIQQKFVPDLCEMVPVEATSTSINDPFELTSFNGTQLTMIMECCLPGRKWKQYYQGLGLYEFELQADCMTWERCGGLFTPAASITDFSGGISGPLVVESGAKVGDPANHWEEWVYYPQGGSGIRSDCGVIMYDPAKNGDMWSGVTMISEGDIICHRILGPTGSNSEQPVISEVCREICQIKLVDMGGNVVIGPLQIPITIDGTNVTTIADAETIIEQFYNTPNTINLVVAEPLLGDFISTQVGGCSAPVVV